MQLGEYAFISDTLSINSPQNGALYFDERFHSGLDLVPAFQVHELHEDPALDHVALALLDQVNCSGHCAPLYHNILILAYTVRYCLSKKS